MSLDRSGPGGRGSSKSSVDDLGERRGTLDTRTCASDQQRRDACEVMAGVAYEHPGLTLSGEREAALREVLVTMGLKAVRSRRRKVEPEAPKPTPARRGCGAYAGTERGYRRHLSLYEKACDECRGWRTSELTERWEGLGLEHGTYVRLPE